MAAVLHVYKEVEILKEGLLRGEIREPGMVTVSYDEKPGIQALAQKTPDRPAVPGQHGSPTRDYEYQRLGTVSFGFLAAFFSTRSTKDLKNASPAWKSSSPAREKPTPRCLSSGKRRSPTLNNRQRRVRAMELSLTPLQVVMVWLRDAAQAGTSEEGSHHLRRIGPPSAPDRT
jgi:hypothetical protein